MHFRRPEYALPKLRNSLRAFMIYQFIRLITENPSRASELMNNFQKMDSDFRETLYPDFEQVNYMIS